MMTEALLGKTADEAQTIFTAFHQMLTQDDNAVCAGKLAVLAGVKAYPARVKCATLAWHTLSAALNKQAELATTE